MLENGFITLPRRFVKWRWFKDANTSRVMIYILLQANYEDYDFENITVKRGQMVTSYPKIAEALNISVQNVRTAINHLKSTGELTVKTYPKYSVITVLNYDEYQGANSQTNSHLTASQQSPNSLLTPMKEDKEYKKDKIIKKECGTFEKSPPPASKKFIPPTVEEVEDYCSERKNNIDAQRFVDYYTANGWKVGRNAMKDWKATVRRWEHNQYSSEQPEKETSYDINEYEEFALMFGIKTGRIDD